MKKYINEIKLEASLLSQKTDEELILKGENIKKRLDNTSLNKFDKKLGKLSLDDVLIEWFALVQELSYRTIGLKHFDTQLLAGIFLHQGKIVEMKTGEGKTLASTLPVSLNALSRKGVHVVTVNDYLAERDKNWMGKVYKALNLTVGLVKSEGRGSEPAEKRRNYLADITYLTNSELVFDYLRDSSAFYLSEIVQRPFNYCIIDEIDSILIDEARTPLILSTVQGETNVKKLSLAKVIINFLEKDIDFEVDQKRRDVNLTEKGYQQVKEKLGKETLYDLEDPWLLEILNALKAKYLFKLNKDYIVLNNKILIIDEFTGRVMSDRRWSLGIHEAIEMKENVEIGNATKTKSSITYQNFFTLYPKLAGMTGTAKTADKEFKDIYNLDVIVLPTSKPMLRKDLSDLVYQTELAKWKAVLAKSKECFENGQPILIGTSTVEKSEFLSDLFKISKIPHQVLNALPENITRESQIVAQAGEPYSVTIATNMAGRGTDIILGGNPTFKVQQIFADIFINKKDINSILKILTEKADFQASQTSVSSFSLETEKANEVQKLKEERLILKELKINKNLEIFSDREIFENYIEKIRTEYQLFYKEEERIESQIKSLKNDILNLPYSLDTCFESFKNFYNVIYEKIYVQWEKENGFVKSLGGLFVLGTERHETRRIDNQLRGRAGRQGDPGFSQFFVSLDDELIKIFGAESIRRWLDYLMNDKDVPLESKFLTESLENAQKKVESYNYEIRKNVFQYDEVINIQRNQLFKIRNEILSTNIYNELALRYSEFTFDLELLTICNKIKIKKFKEDDLKYLLKENRMFEIKNTEEFFYLLEKCFGNYSTFLLKNEFNDLFKQKTGKHMQKMLEQLFTPFFRGIKETFKSSQSSESQVPNNENKAGQNLPIANNLNIKFYPEIWISNDLRFARSNIYQLGFLKNTQTTKLLSIIDFYWAEHIERLNYIRDTINWRAYGQQNPLIEYNSEAFYSYKIMLEKIRSSMLYYFLENPILKQS